MVYPIDNLKEDAYVITNSKGQFFIPAPIFEGLCVFANKYDWDSNSFKKSTNGIYYGTTSNGHYIALGTRFYFAKGSMKEWHEILLNQKDSIEFVPMDKVNYKSNFQSMTSKDYSFQIDPETMRIIKSTVIDFVSLSRLFVDFCDMVNKMSEDIGNPIHPKDIVIFDDAKYRDGFINFSKGKRREINARQSLLITKHQFHVFDKIVSNGDCTIDQIRFQINFDDVNRGAKRNDMRLSKDSKDLDDGVEIVHYPGGSAYLFPLI